MHDHDFPRILRDEHDQRLLANVHPPGWVNPEPRGRYNLVVLGAGTAGLVAAAGAAGLHARVALIERGLLGGDCLNFGCVPSKAMIRSSRAAADARNAGSFGVRLSGEPLVDFAAVMERMRILRAGISEHDSSRRFRDMGVDVYLGEGRFTGLESLEVGGTPLRFCKAVIATGARPALPPIEGLSEVEYFTNETIFSLASLPERLAVIGGGPLGSELAQVFQRLGSKVTIFQSGDRILNREDPDAVRIIERVFAEEGIRLVTGSKVTRVFLAGREKVLVHESGGREERAAVDAILVGVGRTPNVEGIGLELAGVKYNLAKGVLVDDYLRTSNSRIFAAGDVCLDAKFTHTADAAARIVVQNALFIGRKKLSALTIPRVTYTDPEIAVVGIGEAVAEESGVRIDTVEVPLSRVDRAVLDGEEEGFVKIHLKRGTDRILGATIVARHAGEMISEISLAMAGNLGLKTIAKTIHPYPTQAEAIKRAADLYNRSRLTPLAQKIISAWMRLSRLCPLFPVLDYRRPEE